MTPIWTGHTSTYPTIALTNARCASGVAFDGTKASPLKPNFFWREIHLSYHWRNTQNVRESAMCLRRVLYPIEKVFRCANQDTVLAVAQIVVSLKLTAKCICVQRSGGYLYNIIGTWNLITRFDTSHIGQCNCVVSRNSSIIPQLSASITHRYVWLIRLFTVTFCHTFHLGCLWCILSISPLKFKFDILCCCSRGTYQGSMKLQ